MRCQGKMENKIKLLHTLEESLNCGSQQSTPGEGNGTPLQYSCLKNPMDEGAWQAAVHGVAEGQTGLSDFTFTFHFHALEKEMFLPGESQGRGSLVGCRLWGRTELDTTDATQQQQQQQQSTPGPLVAMTSFCSIAVFNLGCSNEQVNTSNQFS